MWRKKINISKQQLITCIWKVENNIFIRWTQRKLYHNVHQSLGCTLSHAFVSYFSIFSVSPWLSLMILFEFLPIFLYHKLIFNNDDEICIQIPYKNGVNTCLSRVYNVDYIWENWGFQIRYLCVFYRYKSRQIALTVAT